MIFAFSKDVYRKGIGKCHTSRGSGHVQVLSTLFLVIIIKDGLALTNLNSKSMTELSGIILSKLDLWWDSNQLEAFALVRMRVHG